MGQKLQHLHSKLDLAFLEKRERSFSFLLSVVLMVKVAFTVQGLHGSVVPSSFMGPVLQL